MGIYTFPWRFPTFSIIFYSFLSVFEGLRTGHRAIFHLLQWRIASVPLKTPGERGHPGV